MKKRKNTRVVKIGALAIGGENPIAMKSELITSILEQQMGAGLLSGSQKSIIDRCTASVCTGSRGASTMCCQGVGWVDGARGSAMYAMACTVPTPRHVGQPQACATLGSTASCVRVSVLGGLAFICADYGVADQYRMRACPWTKHLPCISKLLANWFHDNLRT